MDGSTLTECLNESERKRGLWSENLGRLLASLYACTLTHNIHCASKTRVQEDKCWQEDKMTKGNAQQTRVMIINHIRRRLLKAQDEKQTLRFGGSEYVKIMMSEWEALLNRPYKNFVNVLIRMEKDGLIKRFRRAKTFSGSTYYSVPDLWKRGEDYTARELYKSKRSKALEILNCYAEVTGQKLNCYSRKVYIGACVVVKRFFGGSVEKFRQYLEYLKSHYTKIKSGIFDDAKGVIKFFFVKRFATIFERCKMNERYVRENTSVGKKYDNSPMKIREGSTEDFNKVDFNSLFGFLDLNGFRDYINGCFRRITKPWITEIAGEYVRFCPDTVNTLVGVLEKKL